MAGRHHFINDTSLFSEKGKMINRGDLKIKIRSPKCHFFYPSTFIVFCAAQQVLSNLTNLQECQFEQNQVQFGTNKIQFGRSEIWFDKCIK